MKLGSTSDRLYCSIGKIPYEIKEGVRRNGNKSKTKKWYKKMERKKAGAVQMMYDDNVGGYDDGDNNDNDDETLLQLINTC